MQDFFTSDRYAEILVTDRRVVTAPAFVRETGQVFIHMKRYGLGERIIMPLAADGARDDGIFGATIYSVNQLAPVPGVQPDRNERHSTLIFAVD